MVKCNDNNAVVVFIMNGFNEDLLKHMPHMQQLKSKGFSGKVVPTFPYENEPVNFSFLTGSDPNIHGVVANHFFDQRHGELDYKKEQFYRYNPQVKPLWAYRGLRTECVDIHGSEFSFYGQKCSQSTSVSSVDRNISLLLPYFMVNYSFPTEIPLPHSMESAE